MGSEYEESEYAVSWPPGPASSGAHNRCRIADLSVAFRARQLRTYEKTTCVIVVDVYIVRKTNHGDVTLPGGWRRRYMRSPTFGHRDLLTTSAPLVCLASKSCHILSLDDYDFIYHLEGISSPNVSP